MSFFFRQPSLDWPEPSDERQWQWSPPKGYKDEKPEWLTKKPIDYTEKEFEAGEPCPEWLPKRLRQTK